MPFFNDGREAALHQHVMSESSQIKGDPAKVLNCIHDYVESKTRMMIFQRPKVAKSKEVLEKMDPKPKIVVELGTYVGNSAVAWGAMLRDWYGPDAASKGCKVYTCELEESFCGIARDFVKLAGLAEVVSVEQGKSEDTIRRLVKEGKLGKGGVDMLFIDHWEDAYLPDLKVVEDLGLLREGSVIVADNTDIPGAPDYLKYVKARESYRSETVATMAEKGLKDDVVKERPGSRKVPNVLEVSWVL